MNKLEKEIWDRYGNFELSHDKNKLIVENINEFIEKHCVGFAKWRMGSMYDKEKGIDGKAIIRQNPDDYWEKLFNHYIQSL